MAPQSILDSVKKIISIPPTDTSFDIDVILQINSVFATLNQLGVGPANGYEIEDNTATWDAFFSGATLNNIKTYVCLKVRMYFDPPQNSFVIEAMNKQLLELEVRINTQREGTAWVDPSTMTTDPATGLPLPPTPPELYPEGDWWVEY